MLISISTLCALRFWWQSESAPQSSLLSPSSPYSPSTTSQLGEVSFLFQFLLLGIAKSVVKFFLKKSSLHCNLWVQPFLIHSFKSDFRYITYSVADPHHFDPDPDPDPACHFDPDPSFQRRAQNLEKVPILYSIFHTFWLVICKLMRIRVRIQLITLMRTHAVPDLQHLIHEWVRYR